MANKVNMLTLLKLFAQRQNHALISFAEFCAYIQYYAQKHLHEVPELVIFLKNPETSLQKYLSKLETERSIIIVNADTPKKGIIVISFYVEKYANRYREILNNPAIPYPLITDLPSQTPLEIIDRQQASGLLTRLFDEMQPEEKRESGSKNVSAVPKLYGLILPRDMPIIIFPSETSVNILFDIAMAKIRQMLRKEEYHDYFLKKLRVTNPGKDISIKSFFTQFIQRPMEAMESIRNSGEVFYFWGQLCFFIRQDYEKVKDYTQEDIALLQSIYLTEIAINYYKNKSQQAQQKDAALRVLEQLLDKPPFYFNKETIQNFSDSKGRRLLGQYTEKDLNEFLHAKTTAFSDNNLPELLTFKLHTGEYYYITKSKVIPLIIRLCSDARETIKNNLTKEWFTLYKHFDSVPAMTDKKAFERRLEQELLSRAPILYALLHSNFLSLIYYETLISKETTKNALNLFADGKLLPYSELLMLSRSEIITDAKILLPWWYTLPPISWIAAFILRPRKRKKKKTDIPVETAHVELQDDSLPESATRSARKKEFRTAAEQAEKVLVPPGSSLDREMTSYINQWNPLLDKELRANLTEDVNSLIRDYMRRTIRTLKASNFTVDRIQNLAEILIKTSSLQKIKNKEPLQIYVVLYIIRLVKNG
ncbi:hypothetical protein H0R92_11565 [Treponema sp. OMZ 840]|uniref:hypothetical protein n=1 Tax=Treponema sp. OMZ 840 TaxID=244313 RepID=UPI003D8E4551